MASNTIKRDARAHFNPPTAPLHPPSGTDEETILSALRRNLAQQAASRQEARGAWLNLGLQSTSKGRRMREGSGELGLAGWLAEPQRCSRSSETKRDKLREARHAWRMRPTSTRASKLSPLRKAVNVVSETRVTARYTSSLDLPYGSRSCMLSQGRINYIFCQYSEENWRHTELASGSPEKQHQARSVPWHNEGKWRRDNGRKCMSLAGIYM